MKGHQRQRRDSKWGLAVAAAVLIGGLAVPQLPQGTADGERVRDLEGQDLGPAHAFDLAVGGSWSNPWGQPLSITPLGPGIYSLELQNTGTGWSERFVVGLPAGYAHQAPALVLFPGYGQEPEDLLSLTSYFPEAQARGWFVIAPLGAHKYHFSIDYAQDNVEQALAWCVRHLPLDLDRLYAVGFSMGGGMATSYAARHQDPRRAQFAAVANHTGTASIRDVYWQAGDQALLQHPLMFGGSPDREPFAYQRASTLDLDTLSGTIGAHTDMVRNLAHLPVRSFAASQDPVVYLVNQTQAFDDRLQLNGGTSDLHLLPAARHTWDTLDETTTLDWLASHTLADPDPTVLQHILADRGGRWQRFTVRQRVRGAFTPFTWQADPVANRLFVVQAANLRRLEFAPRALGLGSSTPLELVFECADPRGTDLVLRGFASAPADVQRNGQSTPAWTHDPARRTLTLHEVAGASTPTWRVLP